MAISSDTKSLTPEELPADNTPAETPADKEPTTRETLDEVISVSPDESNPAVLDPEEGTAETLPDSEEYEQIL